MSAKDRMSTIRALGSRVLGFLKNTLLLIRSNWAPVVAFIFICSVFALIATKALTWVVTEALMLFGGTTYISPANLASVALNPPSVVVLVLEQVVATYIALFQTAGLLHAYSMSQVGLDTDLASLFAAGRRVCRKVLRPKNWGAVVFVLVLLPLTRLMPLSGTTYKLVIPGFVNQTIEYTSLYRTLDAVAYALLLCWVLAGLFSINLFVLRDDDFPKSRIESVRLGRGHYLHTVACMGTLMLVLNVLVNTVASALVVNAFEFMSLMGSNAGAATRGMQAGTYIYALRQVLRSLVMPAVTNAGLTVLFYEYIDESSLLVTLSPRTFRRHGLSVRTRRAVYACAAAVVVGAGIVFAARYAYLVEPVDRPLVCAHRGDNIHAPENTMPAFELAFSENLPWIELDVHQTADGVIVVSHDPNLSRVTGHDLAIAEHTYEELARCGMGSWMPGSYEHVVIPTLEEVLTQAKAHGTRVQVELKGSEGDVDFEEHVLEVINACGMHDEVMVICLDAERMMRVAELDPTITKGYCMFVARGHLEDIPYTDNVSIEESNVTPDLVHRMHEQGIMVFCWTVDLDDTVQYLVSCDVDVIGTDDPMLISEALDHASYAGGLARVGHILLHATADMAR